MNERTFAVVSNILSAMPSSQAWDERVSMAYAIAMKGWDDKLAEKTVMKALMTKKWRPAPAELREIALQVKRIIVPTPTAQEQIRHVVLYYPENQRKQASERLVNEGKISPLVPSLVKHLGGWGRIGTMPEDKLEKAIVEVMEDAVDDPVVEQELSKPLPALEASQRKMIGGA